MNNRALMLVYILLDIVFDPKKKKIVLFENILSTETIAVARAIADRTVTKKAIIVIKVTHIQSLNTRQP